VSISQQEAFTSTPDGRLAYKIHGNAVLPLLALHGWRDNAATFDRLAPRLSGRQIFAPDFPGHGLSSPRAMQGNYETWGYLEDVQLFLNALELEQTDLLGHSMGGAVACLYAALFPERIKKLVLLDTFGPRSTNPEDAPDQMRKSLLSDIRGESLTRRRYYPDREKAIEARARVGLSMSAAALLAQRSLSEDEKGWYWHTDPRLKLPSRLSLSEAHIEAFVRRIECPVLIISSPHFWIERKNPLYRLAWFKDCRHVALTGHHHQHLDGQVEAVAELVAEFLG
jgi:pimeloyl-ACP methyl ester carboxylesterase